MQTKKIKSNDPDQESNKGRELDDAAFLKMLQKYREQIVIPDHKPERQFILCPVGLVGAGKTTVVKPLAERLHLVRISTDEIRKILKEEGYNQVRAQEIAATLAKDFGAQGYSIAADADCSSKDVGEMIVKMAAAFHAKVIWIHINPPEEFILNKLRTFKHTWLFKDADEAVANYYRRKPLHEKPDFPFTFTFDTSQPSLDQQIEQAVNTINEQTRSLSDHES